ncbi:hypothetical protein VE03_04555 [Pseudogymnoascus sp. 23342-1-I1]|nr:hypothetical protein VE03_04555 [Pseudogymnoascus sp. 23342-1-I1]
MPSRLIPRPVPSRPRKPTTAPTAAPPKIQKTVSTAAILKRKPMAALHSHSYRAPHRRQRDKGVHPLVRDYQDDVASCLASAESRATTSLSDAHAELLARVGAVKDTNTTTLHTLQTQSDALLAPLDAPEVDDTIPTTTTTTATTTKTILSEQIATFRADLLKREKELEKLWKLRDEAQGEIEKLGEGGYGDVLGGWEGEVRERIVVMEGEVEEAGREAVRGVEGMEKEIDRKLREDQAKLVAMMFGEE